MRIGPGLFYMPNPKLSERTPRLSASLNPFVSRSKCQRCGTTNNVQGWIEHDHRDKPEPFYVFLCPRCSNELIDPHPRLYSQVMPNAPHPGIMDICADCKWRVGSLCTSRVAMFNGGPAPGLAIKIPEPASAFVDGPKFRGRVALYHSPATDCSGKEKNESIEPTAAA